MLAIVNGKILTMAGRTFDPGTILIEEGRIVAVVEELTELGDKEVIDANGKVITRTHRCPLPCGPVREDRLGRQRYQ